MSAVCSHCGDCCEVIPLNRSRNDLRWWWDWRPWRPAGWRTLLQWSWWRTWLSVLVRRPNGNMRSARFILDHWHEIPNAPGFWTCDQFDAASRLCLAHAKGTKPPICIGYPWYETAPTAWLLSRRCSYWADVPADQRPADLVAFAV